MLIKAVHQTDDKHIQPWFSHRIIFQMSTPQMQLSQAIPLNIALTASTWLCALVTGCDQLTEGARVFLWQTGLKDDGCSEHSSRVHVLVSATVSGLSNARTLRQSTQRWYETPVTSLPSRKLWIHQWSEYFQVGCQRKKKSYLKQKYLSERNNRLC